MYIISDVHGNAEGLSRALHKAKIIDNHGERETGQEVVQIGDLMNCVNDSIEGDIACLKMLEDGLIDKMLIGNHEIPYFDETNRFGGFHHYEGLSDRLHTLKRSGKICAAMIVGGTLVTHAGITKQMLPFPTATIEQVEDVIETAWHESNFNHSLLNSCGVARYGMDRYGGIVWCDFDREFTPTDFPQVVGHTVGGVRMKGNALCIDVGSKSFESEPFVLRIAE